MMDTFLDMALAEDLRTSFISVDRNKDLEAQRQILGSPYTVIGTTDGGARPDNGDRTDYSTRLLSYWVREKQVMSLEEAVYRMTGKTALMHDLHDRGFLPPGRPLTSPSSTRTPMAPSPASPCIRSQVGRCTSSRVLSGWIMCLSTARCCWITASTPAPCLASPQGSLYRRTVRSARVVLSRESLQRPTCPQTARFSVAGGQWWWCRRTYSFVLLEGLPVVGADELVPPGADNGLTRAVDVRDPPVVVQPDETDRHRLEQGIAVRLRDHARHPLRLMHHGGSPGRCSPAGAR